MRTTRQPLDLRHGLLWVQAQLFDVDGAAWSTRLILDTGTASTILSVKMATLLGFPESRKLGTATIDTSSGIIEGYTVRLPKLVVMKREFTDYLVGVERFQSKIDVPGILGLDFFENTDLLLSFLRRSMSLAW